MPAPTIARVPFRTQCREAAVALAQSFAAETGRKLQVYPGRPATLYPPTAFVNRIRERLEYVGPVRRRRMPIVELVFLHAVFDSGDTVEAGDAFVDEFLDYVTANPHAANGNSTLAVTETVDDPNFVPDWVPPDARRTYYATIFALEGLTLD